MGTPHADVLTFLSVSDPWVYALGYPGYWDVVFNNLSKNEITSSSANYFKFFAIKIGDVYATSTSGGNDWVCGTGGYGSYLREGNIVQTRSILHEGDKLGSVRLEKGDETTIEVQLKYLPEELGAIQLMLNIDHALAEVMDVQFIDDFQPYYHYRKDLNQLAMISYSKNAANPLDIKEGVLASITLRAKSTISDLDDMISWSEKMENELIGMEANYIGGELELRIKDINRKSMIIDIHSGNGNPTAIIYSPENVKAQITITDVAGRRISSKSVTLQEGRNEMLLEQITDTGIYIFNLNTGRINQSQKFFNQ